MASPPSPPPPPPPSPPPPPLPLNFLTVLSEARRILSAHSRHFLALSVLFLLPLSFAFIIYPTLISPSSSADPNPATTQSLLRLRRSNSGTFPVALAFTAVIFLFSVCATTSITHSTVQGFYGRPVKLLPALKSIFTYVFPLCVTVLCTQLVMVPLFAIYGFIVFLALTSIQLTGLTVDLNSPYVIVFTAVTAIVFSLIMFYLQVLWALVNVLVVAESLWGFSPLKRSTYLVKGMRKVALSLILFFGFAFSILICGNSLLSVRSNGGWKSWAFVLEIVVVSSSITVLMLLKLAATVVLYMYCKAIHGELALEIAEEFARDYVSLPFDDDKVPHVVSVAYV